MKKEKFRLTELEATRVVDEALSTMGELPEALHVEFLYLVVAMHARELAKRVGGVGACEALDSMKPGISEQTPRMPAVDMMSLPFVWDDGSKHLKPT